MPILQVALNLPLRRHFDYVVDEIRGDERGLRVRVPFAHKELLGVVLGVAATSDVPLEQLKPIIELRRDLPPLPEDFLALCEFTASYYQAALGEVLLGAIPKGLKQLEIKKRNKTKSKNSQLEHVVPDLTPQQTKVIEAVALEAGFQPYLLYGVTGSGKTEVYLRLIERALALGGQALVLVPEINLTPQLEERVRRRFPERQIVALHSELTEAAREKHWLAAWQGTAEIVLGTRLAIFTPMPQLRLIVVDEEHDASFKQQEGVRYSARDLAVWRARQRQIPIVLGSATPALETWQHAQNKRYTLLELPDRANANAALPQVSCIDTRQRRPTQGLSQILVQHLAANLERGEQSLIFLNRRGYAPVLACPSCTWVARCKRCTANLVLHAADKRLRCHHCGFEALVPRACPDCGEMDIQALGRGTQRLEEYVQTLFPSARVLRVDRDSAKSRKQWEALLTQIHGGEVDILVGTQMLAKGHDFPRLTLVGVLGADAALFSPDCRAPERLFAQLMQVGGRAGRAELPGRVLIQTDYPDHPLYQAVQQHDYPRYAKTLLQDRADALLPPFSFQAMLRADAPDSVTPAMEFLQVATQIVPLADFPQITLYDPVPMRMTRLANRERAQLLVESNSRPALLHFLKAWYSALAALRQPRTLRWHIEVDPVEY